MSIYNGPLASDLAADLVDELTTLREDISKWQIKERAILTLLEFDPAAEAEPTPTATFTAASARHHAANASAPKAAAAPSKPRRGGGGKRSGLEDTMIFEILDRIAAGENHTFLAAEFGVSRQTIGNIRTGKGYFEPILREWEAKRTKLQNLAKGRAKA